MKATLQLVAEAIRGALVEIEQCEEISQGVEDDLVQALKLLEEMDEYEQDSDFRYRD